MEILGREKIKEGEKRRKKEREKGERFMEIEAKFKFLKDQISENVN